MRIGFNGRFLSAGCITGVEQVALQLLGNLLELDKKNEYFLFADFNSQPRVSLMQYPNLTWVKCRLPASRLQRHLWEQMALPALSRKYDCHILHNPINTAPIFGVKNSVTTVHDLAFMENPEWFSFWFRTMYRALIPQVIKRSALIITVSEFSKNEILRHFSIKESKIKVISNGVDDTFFKPDTEGLPSRRKKGGYILYVGSINPRKNLQKLVAAFMLAKEKYGVQHRLVIAGVAGKNFAKVNIPLGVEDIEHLGYINHQTLVRLYHEAALFIYPSLYEGFGLPVLEAMASGVPVITSNTSALLEIADGAAYLVDPYDIEKMARAIARVCSSEELYNNLVKNGLDRARSFGWKRCASEYLSIYQEVGCG